MISEPTYQAARVVAEIVERHFAQRLAEARLNEEPDLASVPPVPIIEAIIDTAFWASLRREEGHSPRISLAFLPPAQAVSPILFKHQLPLTTEVLTKISPGVERAGIHLGVWYEEDELYIWGTTLKIPNYCFVLDVSEPGLLVIKHHRKHGLGKFRNVAVLIGDQVKVVDEESGSSVDSPALLKALLGISASGTTSGNILVQLSVSMRAHGHGGTLLIVPAGNDTWRESIIHPVKYSVDPPFSGITDLIGQEQIEKDQSILQGPLRREIESIAGLTAVDGATIMNDKYQLLAFGTKIERRDGYSPVNAVLSSEPILGGGPVKVHPGQNRGTRHLSAAQFVHDQQDCLALVASQDGHFTIFSWSKEEEIVQAHRIDTLLL